MKQQAESYQPKKTLLFNFRLDNVQYERLKQLASASGFKNVSDYIRIQLLNPSTEAKLNQILAILEVKKENNKNGKPKQ
jgi:hypothetical protein